MLIAKYYSKIVTQCFHSPRIKPSYPHAIFKPFTLRIYYQLSSSRIELSNNTYSIPVYSTLQQYYR